MQTKGKRGGRTYNPYVFTEQGIYMLMTVLKGELATRQSKALIRIFKEMKDYLIEAEGLIGQKELLRLSLQTTENTRAIKKIEDEMATKKDLIRVIGNTLHKLEYKDFIKEYPNIDISFKITDNIYHDRYIIIDYKSKSERIYHCGASSKDAGKRITTIAEVKDAKMYYPMIDALLTNKNLDLK